MIAARSTAVAVQGRRAVARGVAPRPLQRIAVQVLASLPLASGSIY